MIRKAISHNYLITKNVNFTVEISFIKTIKVKDCTPCKKKIKNKKYKTDRKNFDENVNIHDLPNVLTNLH